MTAFPCRIHPESLYCPSPLATRPYRHPTTTTTTRTVRASPCPPPRVSRYDSICTEGAIARPGGCREAMRSSAYHTTTTMRTSPRPLAGASGWIDEDRLPRGRSARDRRRRIAPGIPKIPRMLLLLIRPMHRGHREGRRRIVPIPPPVGRKGALPPSFFRRRC